MRHRVPVAVAAAVALVSVALFAPPLEAIGPSAIEDLRLVHAYGLTPCDPDLAGVHLDGRLGRLLGVLREHPDQPVPLEGAGVVISARRIAERTLERLRAPRRPGTRPGGEPVPAETPCARRAGAVAARVEAGLARLGPR